MVCSKLIIDGNAVYEIDEQCMEKRRQRLEMLQKKNLEAEPGKGSSRKPD